MRSACDCAAWCFHSFTYACGRSRKRSSRHSGVPSDEYRQHRARSEVGRNPDHLRGRNATGRDRLRHRIAKDVDVVLRILQRPVGRQRGTGCRERSVHDAVCVGVDGAAHLARRRTPAPPARARTASRSRPRRRTGLCYRSHAHCARRLRSRWASVRPRFRRWFLLGVASGARVGARLPVVLAGPVLSRTMRVASTTWRCAARAPDSIWSTSNARLRRPTSPKSCRIVVSGGLK